MVIIMRIIIDADACPVTSIAIEIAKKKGIPVTCICDTSHILDSSYAEIRIVDKGKDFADLAVVNLCSQGDIVITQDYGVASMALAKMAKCINQNGLYFTESNIDSLMEIRHIAAMERKKCSKNHLKGPKKRTAEDNEKFILAFTRLIDGVNS